MASVGIVALRLLEEGPGLQPGKTSRRRNVLALRVGGIKGRDNKKMRFLLAFFYLL